MRAPNVYPYQAPKVSAPAGPLSWPDVATKLRCEASNRRATQNGRAGEVLKQLLPGVRDGWWQSIAPDPRRPGCEIVIDANGKWSSDTPQGSGPLMTVARGDHLPSLIAYVYGLGLPEACTRLDHLVGLLKDARGW